MTDPRPTEVQRTDRGTLTTGDETTPVEIHYLADGTVVGYRETPDGLIPLTNGLTREIAEVLAVVNE